MFNEKLPTLRAASLRAAPAFFYLIACALIALAGCNRNEKPRTAPVAESSATATPIDTAMVTVTTVDGAGYRKAIDGHHGKVVLVDYWATWCGPCRQHFPHTVELADKYRDRGLDCISLSFDEQDSLPEVRKFLAENQATFEHLICHKGITEGVNEEFDFDGSLPYYIVFDRAGKVVKHISHSDPTATFRLDMIDQAVEEALGQDTDR